MIPRVIARLDIKGEKLIKGIQLDGLKTLGNPNEFALKYYKEGIDEIFLVDIVASLYGRNNLIDVIRNSAKNIFIPIIVGGGIRSEDNAYEILKNGADKISLNTAAVENPKLVEKISKRFGSQCVTVTIEVNKVDENKWEVFTHNGTKRANIEVKEWMKKVIDLGAGEIILNSIEKDGTKNGFDNELINITKNKCSVPFIISGGLAKTDHINDLELNGINGICSGTALHYNLMKVKEIKNSLKRK